MNLDRVVRGGANIAQAKVRQVRQRLITDLPKNLPADVGVEEAPGGVVIIGRNLTRRMIGDVRLRSIGFFARKDVS